MGSGFNGECGEGDEGDEAGELLHVFELEITRSWKCEGVMMLTIV